MSQLPQGTTGDAVGVLLYTFICLLANILVLWLVWAHRERSSYVALIGYFTLLCTVSSIVQQIYNYECVSKYRFRQTLTEVPAFGLSERRADQRPRLWEDLMWDQLRYIKANPGNANVIFNNGNFGFQLVLANIRLFCYIIESTYMLSFAIQIAGSVYGYWATHRRTERHYELISKLVPIFPTALTIGLLQAPAVHQSFLSYMFIANAQSVFCCAASMVLLIAILIKYVNTKRQLEGWRAWYARKWKGLRSSSRDVTSPVPRSTRNDNTHGGVSYGETTDHSHSSSSPAWAQKVHHAAPAIYDSWLVTRLAILTVMLSGFILASVLTHFPQKDDIERDAQASEPDLSAGRASSNIVGYMPGVTPGLVLFIVFGTTRPLRMTMYERFVPRRLRIRHRGGHRPSTPPHRTEEGQAGHPYSAIPLQSPPFTLQNPKSIQQSQLPLPEGSKSKLSVRVDAPNMGRGGNLNEGTSANAGSDEWTVSPLMEHEMYHGNWR